MLSKESFVLAYKAFDKEREAYGKLEEALSLIAYHEHGVSLDYCPPSQSALEEILKIEMNDVNDWMGAWDNECRTVTWIDENGNEQYEEITEIGEFYDFLVSDKSKTFDPHAEYKQYEEERTRFENSKEYLIMCAEEAKKHYEFLMAAAAEKTE